jgi:hypothetical protein
VLCWDCAKSGLKEKMAMHTARPNFRLAIARGVNRGTQSNTLLSGGRQ